MLNLLLQGGKDVNLFESARIKGLDGHLSNSSHESHLPSANKKNG